MPESKEKDYIRNMLYKLIREDESILNVFSLTSTSAGLASKLPKWYNVVTAERDKAIAYEIKKKYPHFTVYHNSASDVLTQVNGFDFAWLDFCGPITAEVILCLNRLNMKPGRYVGITLMRKPRRSKFTKHLESYMGSIVKGYKIVDKITYVSTCPMAFYLLIKS